METKRDSYMRVFYISMFIFCALWFPWPKRDPAPHPVTETRIRMQRIFNYTQFLQDYDDKFLQSGFELSETNALLDVLFDAFSRHPEWSVGTYEKTDAWGNQFHVSIDKSITNAPLHVVEPNQMPIRIWSSGMNGINENGDGDDIVCE